MICPSCSRPIPDGMPVCPYCGAALATEPFPWETEMTAVQNKENRGKSNRTLLIALGGVVGATLLLLITVFGIVPAVRNRPPKTPSGPADVSTLPPSVADTTDSGAASGGATDTDTTAPGSGAGEQETAVPETETQAPQPRELRVSPIAESALTVPETAAADFTNDTAPFMYQSGEITGDKQTDTYEFYAEYSGKYRCEVGGLMSGVTVSVYLCDDTGNTLDYEYRASNGEGVTRLLEGGKTYTVLVKSGSGTGAYELTVGMQKAPCDISAFSTVFDAIEFRGQRVDYFFTPQTDGVYRFWISQINSGKKVSVYIYDDAGYQVNYEYAAGIDDGVKATLSAGVTYTLNVVQQSELGAYTLCIGYQKPAQDITGYTLVYDGTTFRGQKNDYLFTAVESGVYSFRIAQINSGIKVGVYVYDSADYCLASETSAGQNDGVTVSLTAGGRYLVQVRQYSDVGTYALRVGAQKPAVNATGYGRITDSTQYEKQCNVYAYAPAVSGTCVFCLEKIPADVRVSVAVYDTAGYEVCGSRGLRAGDAVKAALTAGQTYEIRVTQYSGFGEYSLGVGVTD